MAVHQTLLFPKCTTRRIPEICFGYSLAPVTPHFLIQLSIIVQIYTSLFIPVIFAPFLFLPHHRNVPALETLLFLKSSTSQASSSGLYSHANLSLRPTLVRLSDNACMSFPPDRTEALWGQRSFSFVDSWLYKCLE